jgi:hypothetical protein
MEIKVGQVYHLRPQFSVGSPVITVTEIFHGQFRAEELDGAFYTDLLTDKYFVQHRDPKTGETLRELFDRLRFEFSTYAEDSGSGYCGMSFNEWLDWLAAKKSITQEVADNHKERIVRDPNVDPREAEKRVSKYKNYMMLDCATALCLHLIENGPLKTTSMEKLLAASKSRTAIRKELTQLCMNSAGDRFMIRAGSRKNKRKLEKHELKLIKRNVRNVDAAGRARTAKLWAMQNATHFYRYFYYKLLMQRDCVKLLTRLNVTIERYVAKAEAKEIENPMFVSNKGGKSIRGNTHLASMLIQDMNHFNCDHNSCVKELLDNAEEVINSDQMKLLTARERDYVMVKIQDIEESVRVLKECGKTVKKMIVGLLEIK